DVERAARCALKLRAAVPDARIGVAAGAALVAREPGADALRVSGDAVGLAARLAAVAEPGDVLVADAVWRALPPGADGARCVDTTLPASLRARPCWRLAALGAAAVPHTRLVGRRAELAQFRLSL